jgi:hypothetical protein
MRRTTLAAIGLPAIAGLAAVASLPAAPAAAAGGRKPVAYDCRGWHHGRVEMPSVALSCYGSVVVSTPRWRRWTAASAQTARATLAVDTCRPTCESGRFRRYPATVTLYRVRMHLGVPYYSRMRLRYRHDGPRSYTFRWGRYPGASIPVWIGGPARRP